MKLPSREAPPSRAESFTESMKNRFDLSTRARFRLWTGDRGVDIPHVTQIWRPEKAARECFFSQIAKLP